MVIAAFTGDSLWAPPRGIAGMVFGAEHTGGGFAPGPVIVGMTLHMMLSAVFGVVYALVAGLATRTLAVGQQVVAGMVWGLVLWGGEYLPHRAAWRYLWCPGALAAYLGANHKEALASYQFQRVLPRIAKEAMHVAVSMTNGCHF